LKKSIGFLKYALKMVLVKGEWFDLYQDEKETSHLFFPLSETTNNKARFAFKIIYPLTHKK